MKRNSWIFSIMFIFVVMFLTVGYSSFNTELDIDNVMAYFRASSDIRITDISISSVLNNGESQGEEFGSNSIATLINLPEANSSVTYLVDVTNLGGTYMVISKLGDLPDNLTYEIENYDLNHVLCDDNNLCTLGITKQLLLTIKYKDGGFDSLNTSYNIFLDFVFEEFTYTIYYDSGFGLPGDYQEVEYIESTRSQRINTEYVPKINTRMELDLSFNGDFYSGTSGTNAFFYAKDGDVIFSVNFGANSSQGNTIFPWFDKNYGTSGVVTYSTNISNSIRTNRNTMKYYKGAFSYGSLSKTVAVKTMDNTSPLYIFGAPAKNFDRYNMRVYRLKFYEDDLLMADLVPCYRKSDGRTGLYDLVRRKFLSNVASNEFNIGPEVIASSSEMIQTMSKQVVRYNEATNLRLNTFIKNRNMFVNWNTNLDGSGTSYSDGASLYNLSNVSGASYQLYAQWIDVGLNGGGTATVPYRIDYIEDLVRFSNQVNNLNNSFDKQYILMTRNLDFNDINSYENSESIEFGDINGDGVVSNIKTELTTGLGFPIIARVNNFKGYFDGGGYNLSNLYIYNSNVSADSLALTGAVESGHLSLFGTVNGGKISNLNLDGSIYSTYNASIGGVVGLLENGVIERVNNRVSITNAYSGTSSNVGGIIANSTGPSKILSSSNYGNVNCTDSSASNRAILGGIVGSNSGELLIRDSFNSGSIINGWRVGGISGGALTDDALLIIDRCYNSGNISGISSTGSGQNIHVGGLVGLLWASSKTGTAYIINSYNRGEVYSGANRDASGLIGSVATRGAGYIINSYNAGKITGQKSMSMAAGIANFSASGAKKYLLNNVFNYGTVKGVKNSYSIGYLATTAFSITNVYYNKAVTGSNYSAGTGMSLDEFNSQVFADKLNSNLSSIALDTGFGLKLATDYNVSLCNWILGDKGYPELSCTN